MNIFFLFIAKKYIIINMYWDEIKQLLLKYKKNNNVITHTIIPNKNNKIFNSGFALSIPIDDID